MSEPLVSARLAAQVWRRNLAVYRKTWRLNILPNFFEPVLYLVAMGIGIGAYITREIEGLSYLQYIAPGLVVASAMNGGSFETTYNLFVKMHFGKTYEAIVATPVTVEDAMVGELLWAMTRAVIYGGSFAVVVAAFGLVAGWSGLLLAPVILVTGWLFASLGMLYTSFIKVIDLYSFYFTLWLTPLFLFSGIFFPVSGLPQWAQGAAELTPLYHCVNLGKAAARGEWAVRHAWDAGYVLVLALTCSVAGIGRLRRRIIQ